MNTKMKKFYDPKLSLETLQTYQGYSLQVFTSGRIKLSFHISHTRRVEYYAERPKRFREAYAKQHQRSQLVYPDLFLLSIFPIRLWSGGESQVNHLQRSPVGL
jgi:hypothetical protein